MTSSARNSWRLGAAAIAVVGLLAGCGGGGGTTSGGSTFKGTKKIGLSTALTGQAALYGASISKAAQMAAEDINAAGGINGYKIEADIADDATDPNKAATNTRQMIQEDKVVAMIGAVTTAQCQAQSPISKQEKIIVLSTACNSYQLTTGAPLTNAAPKNPYWVGMVPNTYMEGSAAGIDVGQHPQWKNVYIVSPDYLFGKSETQAFVAALKRTNPSVNIINKPEQWYIPLNTTDFGPVVAAIQAAKPDLIYSNIFSSTQINFINKALQTDPEFFTKYTMTTLASVDELQALGDKYPLNLRLYSRAPFFALLDNNPKMQDFVKRYKERYNTYPSDWSVMTYDDFQVYAKAANKAGTFDSDKVMAQINSLEFDTLRGYKVKIRKQDNQATVGETIGTTTSSGGKYPFPIFKDIHQINGNDTIPPIAKSQALTDGKCPGDDIDKCP